MPRTTKARRPSREDAEPHEPQLWLCVGVRVCGHSGMGVSVNVGIQAPVWLCVGVSAREVEILLKQT